MEPLRIYGFAQSDFVWATRLAAHEKGAPTEFVPADLGHERVVADHPFVRVPVATHGNVHLCESRAICEYIDLAFDGPRLMPTAPAARAVAEQWVSLAITDLDPVAIRQFLFAYIFPKGEGGAPDRASIDACLPKVHRRADAWNHALAATGAFVAGPEWTLADAYATTMFASIRQMPEGASFFEGRPHLTAWFARVTERPSFAATVPTPG
jgi:glutathione S-transferase